MRCLVLIILLVCCFLAVSASASDVYASLGSKPITDSLTLDILNDFKRVARGGGSSLSTNGGPSQVWGARIVTYAELNAMSNKDLRYFITERGAKCEGCLEKAHLLERALEVRALPTKTDEVVSMLTPFSTSAPVQLTNDLLRLQTEEEIAASHQAALSAAVLTDPRFVCEVSRDENSTGAGPQISCRPKDES
eukprot:GILJ01015676.1.p1 GENE.GILJ01015676.1~~GILJ01015676.1.p1  ORF type:complete len:193 (+),score=24.09 GILJ01015676.1:26-604(+)